MEWLNYHHLLYFYTVARTGSIVRACEELRLAPPTVSAQIRLLEEHLGERFFAKSGRGLTLTEMGQVVFRYAEEIFATGRELVDTVKGRPTGRPFRLKVGIADVLPKLIAYKLLEPVLRLDFPVRIVCLEDKPAQLLAELAVHELDVVLSDSPMGTEASVKAFNHLLGECGVGFFATPKAAASYRRRFPKCLDGAPFLFPTENTALRRELDRWFESIGVRPRIAGEFEDSALLKVFGKAGKGVFAAPSILDKEVREQYGVKLIGRTEEVRERFYAISVERKLKHPAVVAICETARKEMFT
jgi:LysR family transcriptional regulator, transcriptional activator of nhaA